MSHDDPSSDSTASHLDAPIVPDASTSAGKEVIVLSDTDSSDEDHRECANTLPPKKLKRGVVESISETSVRSSFRPAAFNSQHRSFDGVRGTPKKSSYLNSTSLGGKRRSSLSVETPAHLRSPPTPFGADSLKIVLLMCLGEDFDAKLPSNDLVQLYLNLPFDVDMRPGVPMSLDRKNCEYN